MSNDPDVPVNAGSDSELSTANRRVRGQYQSDGPTLTIRPEALDAWRELVAALAESGPSVCEQATPEVWWQSSTVDLAVEACGGCPVTRACLAYALAGREQEGVWGGKTERERRELARR